MPRLLSYTITALLSAGVGLIACRAWSGSGATPTVQQASSSSFEADALGFVNWYRLMGREKISHEELTRNLQILESKAIASGRLIAAKPSN